MTGGASSSSPHNNWGNRPRRARGGGGGDWNNNNNNFRGRGSFRGGFRGNRRGGGGYHNRNNYNNSGGWQGRDNRDGREPWNNNHNRFHGPHDDQRRGPPPHLGGPPTFDDDRRGPDANRLFLLSPSRHDNNPPFRNNMNRSPPPRWNNMDRRHGGHGGNQYYQNASPPPQLTSNIPHHSRHNMHAPVAQRNNSNMPPPFYTNDYDRDRDRDSRGGGDYDYKDEFRDGNKKNSNNIYGQQASAMRNNNSNISNSPEMRRQHPGLSMPLTAGSASSSGRNSKASAPRFTSADEPPRKSQPDDGCPSAGAAGGSGINTGGSAFSDAKPPESPPTSHPIDLRNTLTRGSAEKKRDDIRAAAASRMRRSNSNDGSPIPQPNTLISVSHTSPKASGTRRSTSSPRFTNIVPDAPTSTPASTTTPKSTSTRTQSRWSRNTDAFPGNINANRRRSYSPVAFNPMAAAVCSGSIGSMAARETRKIERRPASPPPVPTRPRLETFRSRGTVSEGGKRSRFYDRKKKKSAGDGKNQDESKRWGDVTRKDVEKEAAAANKKMANSEIQTKQKKVSVVVPPKTAETTSDKTGSAAPPKKKDSEIAEKKKNTETSTEIRAASAPKVDAEITVAKKSSAPETIDIVALAEKKVETTTAPKKIRSPVEKKLEEKEKSKNEGADDGDVDRMDLAMKTMKVNDAKEASKAAEEKKEKSEVIRDGASADEKKDLTEIDKVDVTMTSAPSKEGNTEPKSPWAPSPDKSTVRAPSSPAVAKAKEVPLPAATLKPSSPLKTKDEKPKSEEKQRRRLHSPKKRRRTRSESPRFEDIAPFDLEQEAKSKDKKVNMEVVDSEKEQPERVEKNEKVNVPKAELPKGEDGDKGEKAFAQNEADEEKAPEKMDVSEDEKEKEEEIKKIPDPPPTSTAPKSSTVCKVPVITSKLPLQQMSGPLPSFRLRSKPNTPNSAPVNKSKPLFESASSEGVKPLQRFGTIAKEFDGDAKSATDQSNTEGRKTAPKLLEEISAVDLEMKSMRKEIEGLKASLDGSLPPIEDDENDSTNRKLAREFCAKLIIEKRNKAKGEMFIIEPLPRRMTVSNGNILRILDCNRAKARAANAEFKYLHYQPDGAHRVLVEQQRNTSIVYVDSEVVEKVKNTIRSRRKEEREKTRNQVKKYRTLKEIWTDSLTTRKNKTSKEKRDIAKERDRYLLVNTRGPSALLTCKTSSGRTSTKVLPGLSGGNIINVAEVDSMLADIEKFGGTPGTAQIVQRTLAEIPKQNANYVPFDSNNLLIDDPVAELHASRARNFWTQEERLIFLNKFLIHQKNFKKVATFIPNKSTNECVRFYFDNKLAYGLKALVREAAAMKRNGTREMALLKMTGLQPTEYNLTLCGVSQDISATTAKQIAALMGSPSPSPSASYSPGIREHSRYGYYEIEEGDEKIFSDMEYVQKTIERSASPGLGRPERNNNNVKDRAPSPRTGKSPSPRSDGASLRLSKAERIERSASPRFGKPGKAERIPGKAASPRTAGTERAASPKVQLGEGDMVPDKATSPRDGRRPKGDKTASPRNGKRSKSERSDRHRTERTERTSTEGAHPSNNSALTKPKASWTTEERARVESLFKEHGREFKVVAQIMGTKTAAQVKGYWKKFIKEKKDEGGHSARNNKKRDAAEAQLENIDGDGGGKREKKSEERERERGRGSNSAHKKKGTARKIVDDDDEDDDADDGT